jgi:hypothetical protein
LVVSFTTAPDTLDPQKSPLNQTWPAWQLSYECLLKATADGKLQPQLAERSTPPASTTTSPSARG